MNLLIIGPPGSGKGTQGERLAARYGLRHLAAGDILRAEVAAGTEQGKVASGYLSRGELVPDALVVDLIFPAVVAAAQSGGYLLDGFPRSMDQALEARRLAEAEGTAADAVVYLDAPRSVLVARMLERASVEGRADDTPEVFENRLRVYDHETQPLVEYYTERGLLTRFDAQPPIDEVTNAIVTVLDRLRG